MATLPRSITRLIESFERLPGIGSKTASRLTFYLLNVPQSHLDEFATSLETLKKNTKMCSICYNVGEHNPCLVCSDSQREKEMICVVEQPIDILSFERTGKYRGVYHVLHGSLNPLASIGPDEIRMSELFQRIKSGDVAEVIIATNLSTEGEATAMYIKREVNKIKSSELKGNGVISDSQLKITRIAQGLPLGADVQYADEYTLREALEGRREY